MTTTMSTMSFRARALAVVGLTGLVVLAGCGGDDGTTTTDAAPAPSSTTAVTTSDTPAEIPVDTSAPTTAVPSTAIAPTAPPSTAAPSTTSGATEPAPANPSTGGTATVAVGDERFEFMVIQCFRDRPSVFGDQIIDITIDGIAPDTPPELIEPLLGVMDPDTDLFPLIEPVLEYGPALTVSRLEDGGDYVAVYDLDTIEYLSDPDPLDAGARFLEVPDGGSGITVTGSSTSGGQSLELTATCP